MDTVTTPRSKARRNDPRGSESGQMVEQAYNVIDFPPAYIPPKAKVLDQPDLTTASQLFQAGLISRRRYMEMVEVAGYPQIWVESPSEGEKE